LQAENGPASGSTCASTPLPGVEVIDRHTYRIRLKGKYPQFLYWLAMPFFAPVPWEADCSTASRAWPNAT
jgi:ABC-type transport system substrate-binding protein